MFSLKDKVLLLTGGVSGIGLAIARNMLSAEGERKIKGITIIDLKISEENRKTYSEFSTNDRVLFIECDVSDITKFEECFELTVKTFGSLDVVFNNAGILNENEVERMVAINLTAVLQSTKLAFDTYLPKFKSSDEAIIINTASTSGLVVLDVAPAYCATKHGVVALSRCYGKLYSRNNIRVMSLCPSTTKTNLRIVNNLCSKENENHYLAFIKENKILNQDVEWCVRAVNAMIDRGEPGSAWIVHQEQIGVAEIKVVNEYGEKIH